MFYQTKPCFTKQNQVTPNKTKYKKIKKKLKKQRNIVLTNKNQVIPNKTKFHQIKPSKKK